MKTITFKRIETKRVQFHKIFQQIPTNSINGNVISITRGIKSLDDGIGRIEMCPQGELKRAICNVTRIMEFQ